VLANGFVPGIHVMCNSMTKANQPSNLSEYGFP